MVITPITTGSYSMPITGAAGTGAGGTGVQSLFGDMFQSAVGNLQELETAKSQDSLALALGEVDDIGSMMITSEKAQVALQLLVTMRNSLLDAYNEIMRMNV